MLKRVISLILACCVGLFAIFAVMPVRAGAFFPLGVMQSALATYVTSTGYKMWQDQGTGSDLLASIGQLYDDFVTVMSAAGTPVPTLEQLDQDGQVAVDNSGNWIYYHDAAQTFQSFADWAQTKYSISTDGQPVEVVQPSGSDFSFPTYSNSGTVTINSLVSASDLYNYALSLSRNSFTFNSESLTVLNNFLASHNQGIITINIFDTPDVGFTGWSPLTIYYHPLSSGDTIALGTQLTGSSYFECYARRTSNGVLDVIEARVRENVYGSFYIGRTSDSRGWLYFSNADATAVPGSPGLALSLAQTVADHIADSFSDDDAVVIGVGAAAGTDAEALADISAQGILAGDLATDVSITAADVIDTPVQPYPDVEGLGLPSLGAALVERFPFCIPWDFVDTVRLLAADPVAPDFRFDLLPQRIRDYCHITASTEVRFNMGDEKFSKIGVFCRWGSLIGFCFGLAMLTKRMIWTA